MKNYSNEKLIDNVLLESKQKALKKERLLCVFKRRMRVFKILLPLVAVIYILFYTPLFVLNEIEVNDLEYLNPDEIIVDFEPLKGENFFLADLSVLRSEVIKKYPFVERIYTEKVFPNRVIVNIKEKEPFIIVTNDQGSYILDKEGFVLLEGEANFLTQNYVVKEVVGEDLNNIEFVINTQSNFYNASKIYEVLKVLDYYGHSSSKILLDGQNIELLTSSNRTFVFSLLDDLETQFKRLIIILKKLDSEEISFKTLDLRYNRPVLIRE